MKKTPFQAMSSLLTFAAFLSMAMPLVAFQEQPIPQPIPQKQPPAEPVFLSPPRSWNTKDGKHNVVARLTKVDDKQVVLTRVDNGWIAKVPIDILSENDITYLRQLEEQKKTADASAEGSNAIPNPVVVPLQLPEEIDAPIPAAENPAVAQPAAELPPQIVVQRPPHEDSDERQPLPEIDSGDNSFSIDDAVPMDAANPDLAINEPLMTQPLPLPLILEDRPVSPPGVDISRPVFAGPPGIDSLELEPGRAEVERSLKSGFETTHPSVPALDAIVAKLPDETHKRIENDLSGLSDIEYAPDARELFQLFPMEIQPDIGVLEVRIPDPLMEMSDEMIVSMIVPIVSLGLDNKIRLGLSSERLERNPALEFQFAGDFPGAAWRAGFMELDELIDQDGSALTLLHLPPNEPNLIKGWISLESDACVVPIEVPNQPLKSINQVRGTLKIAFVTDLVTIEIPRGATDADLLENPFLVESGVVISMRRPNETTLHLDVSGSVSDIVNVSPVNSDETEVRKSQSVSRRFGWYQFTFPSKVPADTVIQVQIAKDSREVTIPFDFQDVRASE